VISTEEVSTLNGGAVTAQQVQRVIPSLRTADGTAVDLSTASPLPVDDADTQVVLAAIKALLEGTAVVKVGDNGGSLTVDDGGSSLSVDDNGGSLTVDVGTALPAGNNNIGDVDVASLPALPTGTNAIGKLAANSGVDIGDVDVTSIAAGSNLIGDVGIKPRTSGGLSIFRSLDLDESEEQVKGTAGQVYWYHYTNRASAERFLKFYDATEANVTVGTTTPKVTIPLAALSSGHVSITQGLSFGTAITVAATTGIADANTGAPAENDVVLNLGYA